MYFKTSAFAKKLIGKFCYSEEVFKILKLKKRRWMYLLKGFKVFQKNFSLATYPVGETSTKSLGQ